MTSRNDNFFYQVQKSMVWYVLIFRHKNFAGEEHNAWVEIRLNRRRRLLEALRYCVLQWNFIKNDLKQSCLFNVSLGTLSKKRRSRGRGGQQENFHSNGIEVDPIWMVWPPRLLDHVLLLKFPFHARYHWSLWFRECVNSKMCINVKPWWNWLTLLSKNYCLFFNH